MGLGLPKAIWTDVDLSHYVDTILKGVSCVVGITEKGPIGKPQRIGSQEQYARIFGGSTKYSDFVQVVNRALAYGAVLWISRVAHYGDVSDSSTLKAACASVKIKNGDGVETIALSAQSEGEWGNRLSVEITESALDHERFTLKIFDNGRIVETLEHLSFVESDELYVEKVRSAYVVIDDLDADSPVPKIGSSQLTGGDDGLVELCDADYIGEKSAKTGFYAFGEVDDALQIAVPGVTSPAVIAAGISYCEERGDMFFITETPFNLETQDAVDFRLGRGAYSHGAFNSSYGSMYFGKPRVYDITQKKERIITPIGDILGVMAVNDWSANESRVPAGLRRGKLRNCLGFDVNVGTPARQADGDYLCENQINPLCSFPDTGPVVWGAQTLQREASLLRELNVRRMSIIMKKTCTAYARTFIHEPNDPATWRLFWLGLEPKFREWKAKRWVYDYRIECDQNAKTIFEAKINLPESVQRGEFNCKIFYKPVIGIKWILLHGVITRLDANYDESVLELAA